MSRIVNLKRYTFLLQLRIRISRDPKSRVAILPGPRALPPPGSDNAEPAPAPQKSRPPLGGSSRVALGILTSRITGLLRESVFAHYFGASSVADAFKAAVRIPNMLNNLFGEGVLSASFVTVYAKLRALGEDKRAENLAGAVFGVLSVVCSVVVLLGIIAAPVLVEIVAPGFHAERRALTIRLVRVLFPGTAMLALSAWCLGVLNSHRRFLLSYTAPVAMNFAMITCLVAFGRQSVQEELAIDLAWAFVLGSVLQFLVQLPRVLQLLPAFRPLLDVRSPEVTTVIRNFGPIFLGRGVVQISAFVDSIIASKLPSGAVSALSYGQTLALLPISLFSMSISAAELPTLSSATGGEQEVALFLRTRISSGLRRIAFFVLPSAVAFLLLGDVVSGALYQSGKFSHADAMWQWGILAGSAVGLLASGLGRLYSSGFYALLDTKTPLKFSLVRLVLTTVLGFLFALPMPHWFGVDQKWGVAGLTASAGIAGWAEFVLLRHGLSRKIGRISISPMFIAKLWAVALFGGLLGLALKTVTGTTHPRLTALLILSVYGAVYFGGTALLNIEESKLTISAVLRRVRR